jgi:hypothetical protein
MNAAAKSAIVVNRPSTIKPFSNEKTRIPPEKPIAKAIGNPSRFAKIDANVCSCQVKGNQYIICELFLMPLSCICWNIVKTKAKIKINVGIETKKLIAASPNVGKPGITEGVA